MKFLLSTVTLFLLLIAARAEFALRDGDTVAFLGDSITAARGYTKIVEHYALMRFPDRKIHFVNAGRGGDTAFGCLSRLDQDVFDQGATVVTVAFGINDIGWGMKANDESKQRYLDGIRAIIERCKARNVRPIICSAAITAEDPDKAERGYLQTMCDEGLELARSLGAETVDIQRTMREAQRRVWAANEKEKDEKKKTRMHVEDGVHLNDLGQLAMAYALLHGLGAPAEVSNAVLNASTGDSAGSAGCRVSEFRKLEDGISFVREDDGLPITFGGFVPFDFRWVPLPDELNRYLLTVKNLTPGDYRVTVNGRDLGKASAAQLSKGLNISTMTAVPLQAGGPWDAQSLTVKELVDARDKAWMGARVREQDLANHPEAATLKEAEHQLQDALVSLQRSTARPYRYRFELRKLETASGR